MNALQDGFTSGKLTGFSIAADGTVQGRYSNGQTRALGQVVLANFTNPNGLQPLGNNMWAETAASGEAQVGAPGTANLGALQSGAVEESNVDLTAELVDMITAQRNYQANAQTIKTQDSPDAGEPAKRHRTDLRTTHGSTHLHRDVGRNRRSSGRLVANNLANVSTPGFRAEIATFRAVTMSRRRQLVHDNTTRPSCARRRAPTSRPGRSRHRRALDVAIRGRAGSRCRPPTAARLTRAPAAAGRRGRHAVTPRPGGARRRRPDRGPPGAAWPSARTARCRVRRQPPTAWRRSASSSSSIRTANASRAATTACSAPPTASRRRRSAVRSRRRARRQQREPGEAMVAMIALARQFEMQMKMLRKRRRQRAVRQPAAQLS